MRYIKKINELHSPESDVIDDVEMILDSLRDEGFDAGVDINRNEIEITIFKKVTKYGKFNFEDILVETILRLNDYLHKGLKYHTEFIMQRGLREKFYIRKRNNSEEQLRSGTIHWMDSNWPSVDFIKLYFRK